MESLTLFKLDTPYREPFTIEAFAFGPTSAEKSVAIIGSLRGNEVQQTFICAAVVKRLKELEVQDALPADVRILVVPSANSFSMNISSRFWPMDNTDINRMFPGYDQGETTQRIADGLFSAIKDFTYGIQLCSFYLPGDFDPHVRITNTGAIDLERSEKLARLFGFPYMLVHEPSPFDTATLNYNWQVWGTYAFSLYSAATETIDWESAQFTAECVMRFLTRLDEEAEQELSDVSMAASGGQALASDDSLLASASDTKKVQESNMLDVQTRHGGFLDRTAVIGQKVRRGDVLAYVLSTEDCSVREKLVSPCDGTVFFRHRSVLVNEGTIAFTIIAE